MSEGKRVSEREIIYIYKNLFILLPLKIHPLSMHTACIEELENMVYNTHISISFLFAICMCIREETKILIHTYICVCSLTGRYSESPLLPPFTGLPIPKCCVSRITDIDGNLNTSGVCVCVCVSSC